MFINKMTRKEQIEMLDPAFDFCTAYKKCYRNKLKLIAERDVNEVDELVNSAHSEFKRNMQVLKPYFDYGISHNINGSLPWSFPGGGFRPGEYCNSYNACLAIAMRETEEETKLTPDQYRVLDINSQSFRYEDDGVEYDTECFFAVANSDAVACVDVNDEDQTNEVAEVKWLSYEELIALKLDTVTRDYVLEKIREYKWVYETYESRTFNFRSINDF
jgi:8-oxo-dGTP pyrophosphatase MutT (NUDIX family)